MESLRVVVASTFWCFLRSSTSLLRFKLALSTASSSAVGFDYSQIWHAALIICWASWTGTNISFQADLVRTPTTTQPLARSRSEARLLAAAYSVAVVQPLRAAHSGASELRTTTPPHQRLVPITPILVVDYLAKTRLPASVHQRQAAVCLEAAALVVDSALPIQILPLAVSGPQPAALVQGLIPRQTTVPQAHRSRPSPRRMAPPQLPRSSTRPSPSSSHTRTTLLKN